LSIEGDQTSNRGRHVCDPSNEVGTVRGNDVARPHQAVVMPRATSRRALVSCRIIAGYENAAIDSHPASRLNSRSAGVNTIQSSRHVQRESLLRVRLRPSLRDQVEAAIGHTISLAEFHQ
jgi:hypothetical protein